MFGIGQGDLLPDMEIEVNEGEDISGASSIQLEVTRPDGEDVVWALTAVNLALGLVKHEWLAGETDIPGIYSAVVHLVRGGDPQTFPADGTRLRWAVYPRGLEQ